MLRKWLTWTGTACLVLAALSAGFYFFLTDPQVKIARFDTSPARLERKDADLWTLTEDLHLIDSEGKRWTAPIGTVTDGASIPQAFLSLTGSPFSSKFLDAAVIHDAFCGHENEGKPSYHKEPWHKVHRMFYEASLACGSSELKAKLMYAAVFLGGPRWDDPERSLDGVPADVLKKELKLCRTWIEAKNPSIDRIEQWMWEREGALKRGENAPLDWE